MRLLPARRQPTNAIEADFRVLQETSVRQSVALDLAESRILDLEVQLAEQGWMRLDPDRGHEFSREGLRNIVDLARVNYLKNPLIKRACEIGALYVWGQDLSVKAADAVKEVVDRFDRDNAGTLTGQQASRSLDVELRVTGNLFLAFFADAVTGAVKVRQVPVEEIAEIVTNPEDRAEVWYYRRRWRQRQLGSEQTTERQALYPHLAYKPASKPARLPIAGAGEVEIRWDSPMDHVKTGAFPHWRWGVPEVYAALDWARAYKELLEDDATRSRALARFAWKLTTGGGRQGAQNAAARLGTTLGTGNLGETNPPPVAGSTYVRGSASDDLEPIRVAGATLDPDHSRPARLMAAAALGIPDHFFDSDQGNFATSKTLDRPTELQFAEDREMWVEVRERWYQYAIDCDLAASRGLIADKSIAEDADRAVEVSFPSLLEPDVVARVQAVVMAATLSGNPPAGFVPDGLVSQELLSALGVDDIDEWMEKLAEQRAKAEAQAKADAAKQAKLDQQKADALAQQQQGQPANPQTPPNRPPATQPAQPAEALAEAKAATITAADIAAAEALFDELMPEYKGLLSAKSEGDE